MGTIYNGIWKLNAYVAKVAEGDCRLYIGNQATDWGGRVDGCGWTGVGSGELDLNGVVSQYDADGNVVRNWTIVGISTGSLKMNDVVVKYLEAAGITQTWPKSIILPETLTMWGQQPLRSNDGKGVLTNLVMRLPNYAGTIGNDNLTPHDYDNLEIEIPYLTDLGGGSFAIKSTVDVTSWRLDDLTSFAPATGNNYKTFQGKKFTGTLHLPSISTIADNAFLNCSNMSGIDLGSNTVVKSIGAQAFANCSSLVRLKISSDKDLQVAEDAFSGASMLKCIEFGGSVPPSDTTVIDNILAGVPDEFTDNELPCVIYASRLRGWDKLATPAATDEDAQAEMKYAPLVAKESDLIGVYQTADGKRKAWIVHRASDKDPKGTIFVIR